MVTLGDGRFQLAADLRGELPGCSWSARIVVDGPLRLPHEGEPDDAEHEWTVLTTAGQGTATVTAGGDRFEVTGRAYVDRLYRWPHLIGRYADFLTAVSTRRPLHLDATAGA